MNKKKTLFIIAPLETENFEAGVSSRNLEIAAHWDGDVEFVSTLFNHRNKAYSTASKVRTFLSNFDGVRITLLPCGTYSANISVRRVWFNLAFSIRLLVYLWRNAKESDVVLVNSIPPEVLWATSCIGRAKNLSVCVDVRDIWPDAMNTGGAVGAVFSVYCGMFYRLACRKSLCKVLYVSPSFLPWIERYLFDRVPLHFMPLGYDETRWSPLLMAPTPERGPANWQKEKIEMLYVGYLSSQFSLAEIISAISRPDNSLRFNLTVVGDGPRLESYMDGAPDNITFTGRKSHKELVQFISDNQFDVGIVPMAQGAAAFMPNKLFDYIASGLAVLVVNSRDAGQFVVSHGFGWFLDEAEQKSAQFLSNLTVAQVDDCKSKVLDQRKQFSMQALYADIWSE